MPHPQETWPHSGSINHHAPFSQALLMLPGPGGGMALWRVLFTLQF